MPARGLLRYPFSQPPEPGATLEVAPGVRWLRMPLPFALDHINLWVLESERSFTLVDTGVDSAETRALWRRLFDEALSAKPVERVICTHWHPDHIGLAGWLTSTLNVPLSVTRPEWESAVRTWSMSSHDLHALSLERYRRCGTSREPPSSALHHPFTGMVSKPPERIDPLVPDQCLRIGGREWRVIHGQGHSPLLATLYCAEIGTLISGDQVLPTISSHVGVPPTEADCDSVQLYADSLRRLRALPANTLVLPSHGLPFVGLRKRVDSLLRHHVQRLDVAEAACATGATVADAATAMFPRALDSHQFGFALAETLAHLNHLVVRGRIELEDETAHVWRYRARS